MAAPTVPTLPPAPVPNDPPATFDALAGAFVPALNPFGVAVNAVGDYVETTAAEVEVNATVASAAAGLANYQGDWLVGTTYTMGQSVRDDGRYWFAVAGSTGVTPVEGATWTEIIRIPTPVQEGEALVGSGAGLSYTALGRMGQVGEYLNAVAFLSSGVFPVPLTVTRVRGYAVGRGGNSWLASSGGSVSGSGGGMAFGTIEVTPGDELVIDITAGVAKVSLSGIDLLTGNPAAASTSGTPRTPGDAAKHAAVIDGGAFSGGMGMVGASIGGASAASPIGDGVDSINAPSGRSIGFDYTSNTFVNVVDPLLRLGVYKARQGFSFAEPSASAQPASGALAGGFTGTASGQPSGAGGIGGGAGSQIFNPGLSGQSPGNPEGPAAIWLFY